MRALFGGHIVQPRLIEPQQLCLPFHQPEAADALLLWCRFCIYTIIARDNHAVDGLRMRQNRGQKDAPSPAL